MAGNLITEWWKSKSAENLDQEQKTWNKIWETVNFFVINNMIINWECLACFVFHSRAGKLQVLVRPEIEQNFYMRVTVTDSRLSLGYWIFGKSMVEFLPSANP